MENRKIGNRRRSKKEQKEQNLDKFRAYVEDNPSASYAEASKVMHRHLELFVGGAKN